MDLEAQLFKLCPTGLDIALNIDVYNEMSRLA